MIELMSNWLKQIVVLVLIAVFIDLLLPNNTMEKYVKLVMGLLIILAILSPILQLIQQDLDLKSLAFNERNIGDANLASLSSIQEESKKLKESQKRLTHDEVQMRLAEMIRNKVEDQFDVEVVQSRVRIQSKKESSPQIIGVTLKVRPGTEEKNDVTTVKPVEEVEPVIIDEKKTEPQKDEKSSSEDNRWKRKIVGFLQKSFQLQAKEIKVEILKRDLGR
ncbi:stage III sporulation protein AF [Melghirimyces algeriensis]|uniref:Stage III sporulation protein AF n=1 Tax=Melghirimyces algeriensis TaxID=910412 RepID=A0A521AYQ6_9BACL|nr:stage III sporulation protein AF [Melghirimyces algeriensis]SMO39964.1 stage III sporulation protein AF [Melghirimyces algeriensis]